jgi:C-lobe and N-lobe beta barrels of Tf-binding protein B
MRNFLILMSATALAACGGGGGPEAVGGAAPPPVPGGGSTPTPTAHSFVNPTQEKVYEGVGSVHTYSYSTRSDGNAQYDELYAGDASTARDGGLTIAYNPRDAIFEITIDRGKANTTGDPMRFQDPVHRTDFGGAQGPQAGVPNIGGKGILYLEAGASEGDPLPKGPGYPSYSDLPVGDDQYSSEIATYFYQKPGTTTKYVTYAGFVRNNVSVAKITDDQLDPVTGEPYSYLENTYTLERAAFAYGERTPNSAVPGSGSATFTGDMIATMVFNPDLDTNANANTYFQWITGSATHKVDFGTLGILSSFTGTVGDVARDAYTDGVHSMPAGSTFTANSRATIDLVTKGGFFGQFDSASFRRPNGTTFNVDIAGSSIDGAFFGPAAEEIGGGFRIVGGTPDERIDILGAFTGKK